MSQLSENTKRELDAYIDRQCRQLLKETEDYDDAVYYIDDVIKDVKEEFPFVPRIREMVNSKLRQLWEDDEDAS